MFPAVAVKLSWLERRSLVNWKSRIQIPPEPLFLSNFILLMMVK